MREMDKKRMRKWIILLSTREDVGKMTLWIDVEG